MSAMIAHWPPQPCVEDEMTSLEHEQIPPSLAKALKDDDDPAISRGDVDQYPIIVDSDDQRRTSVPEGRSRGKTSKTDSSAASAALKKVEQVNSSDDSAGPATPPPLYRSNARKASPTERSKGVTFQESRTAAKSQAPSDRSSRGRPQIARIDTTLGADLASTASGTQRVSSPYAYTRPSPTGQLYPSQQFTTPSSAQQRMPSPLDPTNVNSRYASRSAVDPRAVLSDEPDVSGRQRRRYRSRSRQRSRSQRRDSASLLNRRPSNKDTGVPRPFDSRLPPPQPPRPAADGNYGLSPSTATKYPADQQAYTPPQSRRPSRDPGHIAEPDTHRRHRYSRSSRDERSQHDSPYTSSAEETSNNLRPRSDRPIESLDASRRPSTQRRERPSPDGIQNQASQRRSLSFVNNEAPQAMREINRRSYHEPITPLTGDPTKSMEAYVERAFKDNETRKARYVPYQRSSGSAIASPLPSPPRTPRSERHSRDYFDVDSSSQRTVQRSRPPSIDEASAAAFKHHASMLSAATVGAALAARTPTDPHNPSKSSTTPRSRRPSPVLEEMPTVIRPANMNQPDTSRSVIGPPPAYTRHSEPQATGFDVEPTTPHPYPQRSASYSGQDHSRGLHGQYPGRAFEIEQKRTATHMGASPMPAVRPPLPHAHTATDTIQSSARPLRLPHCPRSKLVSGYHDWWSIKEISNIDICPTCVAVLRTTPYNHLFVPSLPRPYNEPSVCAMSKPWTRIAFMRAYRQGKPDLSYVADVSVLPPDTRACAGDKSDMRIWFNLIDPATQEPVPNFVACSACARAVDKVFPELEHVLHRPRVGLNHEDVCSLRYSSKHFATFIDTFEQAAMRVKDKVWQSAEKIQPLANSIRKTCRYQECARDRLLPTRAWHFMPDLPEFTVCEECYNEVIWPICDKSLAREICKTTKIVPIRRNSMGDAGISCQLYSERMRKVFRDAVGNRNFAQLRDAAKMRQAAQMRLYEMNRLYETDQKYGFDRSAEIERNNAIWKSLE